METIKQNKSSGCCYSVPFFLLRFFGFPTIDECCLLDFYFLVFVVISTFNVISIRFGSVYHLNKLQLWSENSCFVNGKTKQHRINGLNDIVVEMLQLLIIFTGYVQKSERSFRKFRAQVREVGREVSTDGYSQKSELELNVFAIWLPIVSIKICLEHHSCCS